VGLRLEPKAGWLPASSPLTSPSDPTTTDKQTASNHPSTANPTTQTRRGVRIASLLHGGGQERGARAGTESVLLIAGLGAAAKLVTAEQQLLTAHLRATRDVLQRRLVEAFGAGNVRVNGPSEPAQRLPNTLSISIRGVSGSLLLSELSERLAASAAAACHSGAAAAAASPVLRAMGVAPEFAGGTLRLSTGRHTTMEEVAAAAKLIVGAAARQGVAVAGGS